MRTSLALALSLAALIPACKQKDKEPPVATTTTTTPAEGSGSGSAMAATPDAAMPADAPDVDAAAPAAALTDPQIAAIVVAANQVDIDAGNLALKKSKNAEVKKFAKQMVTDHTAVNKAAVALVTKLKVKPEDSDASKALTSGGADNRAKLEKLDGAEFDRAYVDNEVAYHQAVITVLDTQLIPSATNAELKSTLVGVKPAFDAHLEHAKQVQAQLSGGGAGSGSAAAGSGSAGSGSAHDHGM